MESLTVRTSSPKQTQELGRMLGGMAQAGDVYLLTGDLGTGKTCLTQGLLWGLGGEEYARSPTFVLICEYPARLTLYHMDLYRLDSMEEVVDLGLEEYLFGDGVCVAEWADKAPGAFPAAHMAIGVRVDGANERTLRVEAGSREYAGRIDALRALVADSALATQSQ